MAAITLTIDDHAFPALTASGHEVVGEHFRVRVRALGKDTVPSSLVGKPFELSLTTRSGGELSLAGIVASASAVYAGGDQHLDLELGPEAELLVHGTGSRVHLAKSSIDITKAVFSTAGVKAPRFTTSTTPGVRPTTAQYREDDWSFVSRITREDGLYSFYDHEGGTTLVFADDASAAESIPGDFRQGPNASTGATKWVTSLRTRTVVVSNAATIRDRDPWKPKLDVSATKKEGDGKLEVYAWPGKILTKANATTRAGQTLEALRARKVVVTGASESPALRCGKTFTIEEGPFPAALCSLFCLAVDWSIDGGGNFTITFQAIPKDVPYRLPVAPTRRASLGPETSVVCGASGQEIDVDENGQVFAQPIWDREGAKDDTCSVRIRTAQPALGRSMTLPRIGWGVLVGHEDDDVDRPWVMARLVDGTHPPPYKLPDNMTTTAWQTLTSPSDETLSEIFYEDKKGSEHIDVRAAKDMKVTIGDNEARTIGNRHVLEVGENRKVTIDADEKLTVTKDQTVKVMGAETTTVDGSRSITVKGSEEDSVGGTRTEKTKADRTFDLGKKRTLTVGGTMKAVSKTTFTREVLKKHTLTAGGAWTTQADGGLVMTIKGDSEETIGAARTQNGKEGMQTLVKGDLEDTIAAAHVVTAQGSAGESAKGKMKLTVGAALTMTAPQIEIVAESEIAIVCGGATITIKSGEVAIKGPVLAIAAPMIVADGATVKHNP